MVTDQQVRRLFKLMQQEHTLATAAAKAGMDEKTARKYRRLGKLPSEVCQAHSWRTLRMPTVRACYEEQADLARRESLSYERYLLELLRREREERRHNRIRRWLRG